MHHGIKKLLLLGAGHAHVHVLARLAEHHPADLDVTVLTPYDFQTYSGMTPGFVAGHYSETECQIPLAPLLKAAGARWVAGRCVGLDAGARRVRVAAHPNGRPVSRPNWPMTCCPLTPAPSWTATARSRHARCDRARPDGAPDRGICPALA
jgi:hypothetical protein